MSEPLTRRTFLGASAGAALAISMSACAKPTKGKAGSMKKAVIFSMLPEQLSVEDRFQLARDSGFDGVESAPIASQAEAEAMRAAAQKAGIRVHSVIYGGWAAPLTSSDPAVVAKGLQETSAALHSAKWMGADDILLVPGIVNAGSRYADAYTNSQKNIRKLIPLASELKIMILIEEVWNNFLLSPLEMARYVDEFKSPWVQSYFDVGNVVAFAWPEDWIRTLGKRIHRVHLKDYKGGPGLGGNGHFVDIGEGSINWPEVRKAFDEIGYAGWVTTEVGGGDAAYLKDLAGRVNKVLQLG